ncbi:MAG: response regulator transcription factor [Bacteroidetes bacterium]|nr:response regulator transcription factor [Rhodothermia bacterium]MCS7155641.1 response regulator transcription factor [Bacteroidota bacterium]MCX7906500.1 response regulator transcription factor [Bacteroidota bacterium]MDW8137219.1 response regulator transcription factor [Bacteroidota bacterium]MDW8284911.1 response regulator transcription factor [Bacteroidota bacterium]
MSASAPRILVVEDEEDVAQVIAHFLRQEGYEVEVAYDGLEAWQRLSPEHALVVLDVMLPGIDGFELCRRIREQASLRQIPILFLTARAEEEDQIRGLVEFGGDGYLTKPISPAVLVAHVKAMLRRRLEEESAEVLRAGELELHLKELRASLRGQALPLTHTEFRLLAHLMRHPRIAHSREALLEQIWQEGAVMVTDRTVDAHIKNIREKLGPYAPCIQTVRGVGYRFVDPAELQ